MMRGVTCGPSVSDVARELETFFPENRLIRYLLASPTTLGVITYLLLSGESPFGGCGGPETLIQVRDNILRGSFEFEPADIWQTVSREAKDFILSLLVVDPLHRPTAQEAAQSTWLQMWANRANIGGEEDTTISPSVVKALVGFKEYSDMRKLLCEVLSFTLLPEQIQVCAIHSYGIPPGQLFPSTSLSLLPESAKRI